MQRNLELDGSNIQKLCQVSFFIQGVIPTF